MKANEIKAIISLNGMCQSTIKWRLTDDCNYNCSYCVRKTFKGREAQSLNNYKIDEQNCIKICPEIARIIKELPGNVKLDLIGGEPSLLNLHIILDNLFKECGDKLKRINLTTNMSQSADYYNDLTELCYKYNSEIGITCSWHSEFVSLDKFIEKFSKIKSPTNQKGIRIEVVSREDNQEDIKKLIDICKENNYTYFTERDLFSSHETNRNLICETSKQKKDRYKIITNKGEEISYKTRNDFITSTEERDASVFTCGDFYCSRDYDYVYIDFTEHMGRSLDPVACNIKQPIEKFKPLKEPTRCSKGIEGVCTLCGQISLSRVKEELLK